MIEEAYFRGLLYGFLVMNGVKENSALWIQAILFCLNHYLDIMQNPILFIFGVVPIVTGFMDIITVGQPVTRQAPFGSRRANFSHRALREYSLPQG